MPDRLWKALADAGVFGLLLPEGYGGAGGTLSDLGVFCVEAGWALCSTVVTPPCRRHLPSTCSADPTSVPSGCLHFPPESSAPPPAFGAQRSRADRSDAAGVCRS